jgi:neutral ceramidase
VIFRSAHPNNAPRRNNTYYRIERDLGGGNWGLVAADGTPDTKMYWTLSTVPITLPDGNVSPACPGDPCLWSTTGILWTVPADAPAGQYRIRFFGSWKHGVTKALTPFEGITQPFTIR